MSKSFRQSLVAITLVATASLITQAHAIGAGYSQPYAELEEWSVFKDPDIGSSCFAQTKNTETMMRIVYEDYSGNWALHFAMWREKPELEAQFTFGKDSKKLQTYQFSRSLGWAQLSLSEDQVKNLRAEKALTFKIQGEAETFPLTGSSKAMVAVLKCATNN